MRWYDHLYMGEKAGKHRYRILRGLRKSKLQTGIYVITPASNGNNILDIYPSVVLLLPWYKERDLLILGIASGYFEALSVAAEIIGDMYRKTGGFSLSEYLACE